MSYYLSTSLNKMPRKMAPTEFDELVLLFLDSVYVLQLIVSRHSRRTLRSSLKLTQFCLFLNSNFFV